LIRSARGNDDDDDNDDIDNSHFKDLLITLAV
jgi:hypothetical protein